MQQKQMWITLSVGVIYGIAAMWIMLYAAMHRVVTIEDVGQGQIFAENTQTNGNDEYRIWKNLVLAPESTQEKDIVIPLEPEMKAENVTIENHYMNKEIWIGFDGLDKNFFTVNKIAGNLASVESAVYGKQNGLVWVKFKMDSIYECKSILEDGHLCIELHSPKEVYETVVIVDPLCEEETTEENKERMTAKEITMDIAKRLEEKMKAVDSVRVYYMGMDGENPTVEERRLIMEETGADFYIGIQLNTSEDTSLYGIETIYNSTYFIPGFGNVELADSLTKNVTIQVSDRANGLTEAGQEDMIVQKATIPAVILKAGYLSNEKEAALLNIPEYRDKIAEGIFLTIQEANEKTKNEGTIWQNGD